VRIDDDDPMTPTEPPPETPAPTPSRRLRAGLVVAGIAVAVAGLVVAAVAVGGNDTDSSRRASPQSGEDPTTTQPTSTEPVPSGLPTGAPTTQPTTVDGPVGETPVLVLRTDSAETALEAWTACWGNGCYDGIPAPAAQLDDVGDVDRVVAWSPVADMRWWVTFNELPTEDCVRSFTHRATPYDGHNVVIEPTGPAGRYRVDVFGRGPEGGDVIYSFVWRTRDDGRDPPEASGYAAVLADNDGELDSYGVELSVSGLATHPSKADATITVTDEDGDAVVLDPRGPGKCYDEGSLFFRLEDGSAATELDPGPFTYVVDLVLDGREYTGTGVYPDDVIKGNAPYVRLTWDPPLPSYRVR